MLELPVLLCVNDFSIDITEKYIEMNKPDFLK